MGIRMGRGTMRIFTRARTSERPSTSMAREARMNMAVTSQM